MFTQRTLTICGWCPDKSGIVAKVSQCIFAEEGWILDTAHHSDNESGKYFMRFEIKADSLKNGINVFLEKFGKVAKELDLHWLCADSQVKKKMAIFVSKESHCLYDILARYHAHEWNVQIPAIISNHQDLEEIATWHKIPFYYLPMKTPTEKELAFQKINIICTQENVDVLVLARFMQIIPAWLCEKYPQKIINIHHSFLPSFVGAKPYHQAFARGVKLIGATCHYVTPELDQGPIIEQDVIRIDHSDTPSDLVRSGKEIEKIVLARGLQHFIEDRVLINGIKTVVFK